MVLVGLICVNNAEAKADTKIIYPRILNFVKGDKSQGFDLEEFKAFKAASAARAK